ncbi:beta-alanine-activating enzyme-like isoform X2 [Oscarella lobularis]|uniref:beta-alanine-activating enzyme-like isoform X2 n=1 Tax=Oscarella lobularis TaxID=121494 RepID=UPI003313E420
MANLYSLFKSRFGEFCAREAIRFDNSDDNRVSLTYESLDVLVNRTSEALGCPVASNEVIGLYLLPNHLLPVAILAVIKTGAAYFPVDRTQPPRRRTQSFAKITIKRCLVAKALLEEFCDLFDNVERVMSEKLPPGIVLVRINVHQSQRLICASDVDLAYVMSTSGSTGEPKLVKVPHECIVPNIVDLMRIFQLGVDDVVLLCSPYTFDPSVVEMFCALSSGACLLIVSDVVKRQPNVLLDILIKHNVTVMQPTPALFYGFRDDVISSAILGKTSKLRILAFGGEQCPSTATISKWKHKKNQTRIFNLYGITEVSCWASCHEITELSDETLVPLGKPLSDTTFEVRQKENYSAEKSTIGELWIGGGKRCCLLNDETAVTNGIMRSSGDVVRVAESGSIYYIGRKDSQIKLNGRRVNLISLDMAVMEVPGISSCKFIFENERNQLVLFVTLKTSGKVMTESSLRKRVQDVLPSFAHVSKIVRLDELPLTHHGKVDTESLKKLNLNCNDEVLDEIAESDLREKLWNLWRGFLPSTQLNVSQLKQRSFIEAGGTSLAALNLAEIIVASLPFFQKKSLDDLLDRILHLSYINLESSIFQRTPDEIAPETDSVPSAKRRRTAVSLAGKVASIGRGNQSDKIFKAEGRKVSQRGSFQMSVTWKIDTGKCVDASPLLTLGDMNVVYIGSHSHSFVSVAADSGTLLWKALLGDRIESSAVLSRCGKFLVVGCYDGFVYVLDVESGSIAWKFDTGGEVKSSPCVDPLTGHVWIGSHSRRLVGLSIEDKELVASIKGNGSFFSSPVMDSSRRRVYGATLAGHLMCVCLHSHHKIWVYPSPRPFFSSPSLLSNGSLCIGSTDGNVYCVTSEGEQLWFFSTGRPIFSSPSVVFNSLESEIILIGSHDCQLRCLSAANGTPLWSCCHPQSPIYSTPFAFRLFDSSFVCFCESRGVVHVADLDSGEVCASLEMPSEVFSSPVVHELAKK